MCDFNSIYSKVFLGLVFRFSASPNLASSAADLDESAPGLAGPVQGYGGRPAEMQHRPPEIRCHEEQLAENASSPGSEQAQRISRDEPDA